MKEVANETVREFRENPERAAAEMMVRLTPELEMVSADDAAGTMTIRTKSSGEEVTLSYQDIAAGKFTVTTGGGTMTVDGSEGVVRTTGPEGETTIGGGGGLEKMPAWFEVPEGVTGWRALMTSERGDQVTALVSGEAERPMTELEAALKESLEAAGFQESGSSTAGTGTTMSFVHQAEGRSVTASLFEKGGKRVVQLTYTGKK